MAHCWADGQATPKTSSTGTGRVDVCQVWPPSPLKRSSPLAGTTSLTVVLVVPAARHSEAERHATLCRSPIPAGTVASDQVWPPSALSATAPSPCPLLVG